MKRFAAAAVWGLVLYLALFSGFALLHAYAQDELVDSHGCVIGAWVQNANATDGSAPSLGTVVCPVGYVQAAHDETPQDTALAPVSRGPPLSAP